MLHAAERQSMEYWKNGYLIAEIGTASWTHLKEDTMNSQTWVPADEDEGDEDEGDEDEDEDDDDDGDGEE